MPRRPMPLDWDSLSDDEFLNVRMCDLPVQVDNELAERTEHLRAELHAAGLRAPVHVYLSDEWFTPDSTTSIAIPFYLAHPRLAKLEDTQMLEVEGGEYEWCMRILRHEAGHAIDNAFKLRLRRQRRKVFGSYKKPSPESYTPRPYSKSFVLHLDAWYAQSHPDEDFAETFAAWLTPNSEWRQRYVGWPAGKKLEYMDRLMRSVRGRAPRLDNPIEIEPLRAVRNTLRQHYRTKRRHYGVDYPNFYDRDLRRPFSDGPKFPGNITAPQFT